MESSKHIDTKAELGEALMLVVLFSSVSLLLGALGLAMFPDVPEQVKYQYLGDEPQYSGGKIVFSHEAIYGENGLNELYMETSEEFAFCMKVEGNQVVDLKFPYKRGDPTEESINVHCQGKNQINGLLHSHPGYLSVPELSGVDKRTLSSSENIEVSCVMSGKIEPYEFRNPLEFNCFNDDFQKLEVVIEEPIKTRS